MQTTIQVIDFRDDRYVRANEAAAAGVKASPQHKSHKSAPNGSHSIWIT